MQPLEALTRAEDLLRAGDFARGWPAWDRARAALARYVPHAIPRGFARLPEWRDGPPPRDLVVLQEGGAGDALMVARYAADLAAAGTRVRWQAPPELAGLLRTVPGMHVVYDAPAPLEPTWAWVRALSLPARLGVPGAGAVPYVRVRGRFRDLVGRSRRIGLRATSGPLTPGGVDRNLPAAVADDLRVTLAARGYAVVDLERPADGSWLATARAIRSCRAVVAVDTGVAHLAGALGADLRLVLAPRADWRWGTGPFTPWYPTARLHRAGASWLAAGLDAIADL